MDGTTPKHNCIFWKYIIGLNGGWFFEPWAYMIAKGSYQDLSNEGSKFFDFLKNNLTKTVWGDS